MYCGGSREHDDVMEGFMIIQFFVAMIATASFAVLFYAPKKTLLLAAITGAIGWIIYLSLKNFGYSSIIYAFTSAFVLTLLSRIFAVIMKNPVTMYLIPGIFPIVPGAGIYQTAYYFFMNNMSLFVYNVLETIKIALSITFGIIFALAIPQKLFSYCRKISA